MYVYKLGPYDLKYKALNSYNQIIAPQSTCKSIKHQVGVLPHWFIPSLLPLHLVRTSNSNKNDLFYEASLIAWAR